MQPKTWTKEADHVSKRKAMRRGISHPEISEHGQSPGWTTDAASGG